MSIISKEISNILFLPNLSARGTSVTCDIIAPKNVILSRIPRLPIGIFPGCTSDIKKYGSSWNEFLPINLTYDIELRIQTCHGNWQETLEVHLQSLPRRSPEGRCKICRRKLCTLPCRKSETWGRQLKPTLVLYESPEHILTYHPNFKMEHWTSAEEIVIFIKMRNSLEDDISSHVSHIESGRIKMLCMI